MFSSVLFMVSLFWLALNGPWGNKSTMETLLTSFEEKEVSIDHAPKTINEALDDLRSIDCQIVSYWKEIELEKTTRLSYTEFKKVAIKTKLVFTISNYVDTPILMVIYNKMHYTWYPLN